MDKATADKKMHEIISKHVDIENSIYLKIKNNPDFKNEGLRQMEENRNLYKVKIAQLQAQYFKELVQNK